MFLQFPNDPGCQTMAVEDQFMFGPKWLVAPVLQYQATSRSVYLPKLSNETWVYFFNESFVSRGGANITCDWPL
jgi:alpha-D-xyloside xylohydrolase